MSLPKYTYIIVEDVMLQRENLVALLHARLDMELLGSFESAQDAYLFLADEDKPQPDLIFLDIEMPEVSGFNLLESIKSLDSKPRIIITTAFADYAIKGYEYNVSGYLLKPIEEEKLNQAIDRVLTEMSLPQKEEPEKRHPQGYLMIKEKGKWIKLHYEEILYCEGANVDVKVVTPDEEFLTRERVKNLQKMLPGLHFLRIHDSFIINLNYVRSFASNYTFVELFHPKKGNSHELRIGPKYRDAFRERMNEGMKE